jgi:hypothetical protein
MTDHAEVRELLELAAVEPAGLERLSAGDTAEAAMVAGHLVGCPSCAEEARRLATIGPILREVVVSIPPDALRGRTLALVHDVGRARGAPVPAPTLTLASQPVAPASAPTPVSDTMTGGAFDPSGPTRLRRLRLGWPVALAASVVLSLVVGGALVGARSGQDLRDQQAQTAGLANLNAATLSLVAKPDVRTVALVGTAGGAATGTLLFSASAGDLAMSTSGLTPPPAGQAYSCWMTRSDGSRIRIGTMGFAGELAYWAGWSEELAAAGPGTQFGVTLVDGSGKPVGGDAMTGTVTSG